MEGNFGRDTYRSGYAAAPLISSTPVSHNHPLYRPCRIRQDDFCSSTKIAARYSPFTGVAVNGGHQIEFFNQVIQGRRSRKNRKGNFPWRWRQRGITGGVGDVLSPAK